MKPVVFVLTILLLRAGFSLESPTEIRVGLLAESPLTPVYLATIVSEDSGLPASYPDELEKILRYDFRYDGKSALLSKDVDKDKRLRKGDISSFEAPYAVCCTIRNTMIQVQVFDIRSGTRKTLPEKRLSGILASDRAVLHALADNVHKLLFGTEGIASRTIIYSFQKKDSSGQWIAEIVECDRDGENMHPLTKEETYCIHPVPVPKGGNFRKDLFFYVSYKTGQSKIFIAEKGKTKGKKAVGIPGNQMLPAISLKRDKLAFICDAGGRADLFIQELDPDTGTGNKPKQIFSYPRSSQGSPTFHPDGSWIAFVSDKDGSPRIYKIPSDIGKKRPTAELLTRKNKECTCPSWSPDGKKLAYSAKTEGIRQIWIYDFETKEEKQLTYGPGNKENPAWAPNGLHIVFNSTDDTTSDLYLVNLNQPEAVKITKGPGKKHYPAWGTGLH